ncbi:MAG: divalent-cation tolerance protein CutA [Bacteroidia bacterium]|nr:divalent-cation tolerance protein CutA [Bacteroidia bacterium]MDW8334964.1 divalent-cation tolerance protein CutA [Bacteroidia bacterium]
MQRYIAAAPGPILAKFAMMNASEFCIVYVPVPDEDSGLRIARAAVENRLCACANLFPSGTSVYEWQGKICVESERILMLKTRTDLYPHLSQKIRELHPYSVPAMLKLSVAEVNDDYARWMRQVLNP